MKADEPAAAVAREAADSWSSSRTSYTGVPVGFGAFPSAAAPPPDWQPARAASNSGSAAHLTGVFLILPTP
ncbi:hypothetical protein AB6O49_24695 [Streptomyces sp. SBR177]